jgi:RNA polymerase sigma-70 factor (ECF subfamily)
MAAETLADESDRQLVGRWLKERDEAAFEGLLRRHGPMVYCVCWRILQHTEDVEDVFQATFLILARKLGTLRKHQSLASWLHGVARRVALKAQAQGGARRRRERQSAVAEGVVRDDVSWQEVRTVLDAELTALPEKWRLPLILCYLESRTQDEAAAHLGWSRNTLARRLQEAREALGRRLTRRGTTLSAAFSGPLLSDCTNSATLPPRLLVATTEAGIGMASGQPAPGLVSAKVIALTERMVKAMFLNKLKTVAAVFVLVGTLTWGAWMLVADGVLAQAQGPKSDGKNPAEPRRRPIQPPSRSRSSAWERGYRGSFGVPTASFWQSSPISMTSRRRTLRARRRRFYLNTAP